MDNEALARIEAKLDEIYEALEVLRPFIVEAGALASNMKDKLCDKDKE